MLNVENVVTPSPEQWEAIIRGVRNPMNSWSRSDSYVTYVDDEASCARHPHCFYVGDDDLTLMEKLAAAGPDHRKYLRMIPVYMDITAPLYWWKEYDTYKVGTVANSCSTMHKIHDKALALKDFSYDKMIPASISRLMHTISDINDYREIYLNWDNEPDAVKKEFDYERETVWYQMIQLLPSSYNQRRTVVLNYEVLRNIYRARKNHKLHEWREFCRKIEELPYSQLITG